MYFYRITIVCFILVLFSFDNMIFEYSKVYLPRTWKKSFYSKTKFAVFLNKKLSKHRAYKESKIDLFREVPFWIFVSLLIASLILLIVDFSSSFVVSMFLGEFTIKIIVIILLFPYLIYIFLIILLWRIINRNDYKEYGDMDKEIIDILFSKNKSKKKHYQNKKRKKDISNDSKNE